MRLRQQPEYVALNRFCRRRGMRGPVGRILGGRLGWHIYNPKRVVIVRGSRKGSS